MCVSPDDVTLPGAGDPLGLLRDGPLTHDSRDEHNIMEGDRGSILQYCGPQRSTQKFPENYLFHYNTVIDADSFNTPELE